MRLAFVSTIVLILVSCANIDARGQELTLENATEPAANSAAEALAKSFSLDASVRFLDQAALDWTKRHDCFTCHTNYAYLMARPAVSHGVTAHQQVRAALEELVEKRWPDKGPRWDAEVVMSAAVLALNDAATTNKLHAATRKALDAMWSKQRADGGFEWLKCNWPPMESDDHFGATMAAIAVGAAPGDYVKTDAAQAGVAKLRAYFASTPPPTLHHRAMLVWANSYLDDTISDREQESTVKKLLSLQKEDGGWALANFGDWARGDGTPQDTSTSDGYATGFAIYVLRRAGIAADNPRIQKGIAWLKANQRESGRWFTRSLFKDNNHFISHAGTAFAVLALTSCAEAAGGE
jgi:squalene-hopene/tetraprenyl-beta-curcumene cyclase